MNWNLGNFTFRLDTFFLDMWLVKCSMPSMDYLKFTAMIHQLNYKLLRTIHLSISPINIQQVIFDIFTLV